MASGNDTLRSRPGQISVAMNTSTPPPVMPTPRPRTVVCPYCGHVGVSSAACERCRGLFEPLSRQASQNSMGPWFIRDEANPFLPGCSLATLQILIRRKKVTPQSILRGPSTRQFWMFARNVPGIANLLGECHACHTAAEPGAAGCSSCGSAFAVLEDRERLGLSDVRLLPGHAAPEQIAAENGPPVPSAPPLSNDVKPRAAFVTSRIGLDMPDETKAYIEARQRQRREKRRLTLAVVLLIIVVTGAAAAIALVKDKQDRDARSGRLPSPSEQSTPRVPSEPAPTARPSAVPRHPPEPPGAPGTVPPPTPPLAGIGNDPLLAALASPDIAAVQRLLLGLSPAQREQSGPIAGAVQAAERRLSTHKLARRL